MDLDAAVTITYKTNQINTFVVLSNTMFLAVHQLKYTLKVIQTHLQVILLVHLEEL